MKLDMCKIDFERRGLLPKIDKWLKRNPPPTYWKGTRYEWAYEEAMIIFGWVI